MAVIWSAYIHPHIYTAHREDLKGIATLDEETISRLKDQIREEVIEDIASTGITGIYSGFD